MFQFSGKFEMLIYQIFPKINLESQQKERLNKTQLAQAKGQLTQLHERLAELEDFDNSSVIAELVRLDTKIAQQRTHLASSQSKIGRAHV